MNGVDAFFGGNNSACSKDSGTKSEIIDWRCTDIHEAGSISSKKDSFPVLTGYSFYRGGQFMDGHLSEIVGCGR
jgi:hypothetical protein